MLIQSYKTGDYNLQIHKTKIGYSYKIYYPLNGKRTCVARSYCYYRTLETCSEKLKDEIEMLMGIDTLFT